MEAFENNLFLYNLNLDIEIMEKNMILKRHLERLNELSRLEDGWYRRQML